MKRLQLLTIALIINTWFVSAATYTVTTNASSGAGSLSNAISLANGNAGIDVINFATNIGVTTPIDVSSGTMNITEGVLIDGFSSPQYVTCGTPVVQLSPGWFNNGFNITSPNVTVRGLIFQGDGASGITFTSAAVTSGFVYGCWFGLNAAGTGLAANAPAAGISIINNASGVVVGGSACNQRNVILGKSQGCVFIGSGASFNTVAGNYFNTNAAGTAALFQAATQGCVRIQNGSNNSIGVGTTAGLRNIMAAATNGHGIFFDGATGSNGNILANNYIGFAVNGTTLISPANAAHGIFGSVANTNTFVLNNVINAPNGSGIFFESSGTNNITIQGNYVGTDATGSGVLAVGCGIHGIFIQGGATRVTIGGNGPNQGNTICNTLQYGMQLSGPTSPTTADFVIVSGNRVGVQASGVANGNNYGCGKGNAAGTSTNGQDGIFLQNWGSALISNNVVGNSGPRVNGGNNGRGIKIDQGIPTNLTISGNFIGTDITGNVCQPNYNNGLMLSGNINRFTITNNVIGCNGQSGNATWPAVNHGFQAISGTFTNGIITNNNIGLGANGTANVGNFNMGMGFWSLTNSLIANNNFHNNVLGLFMNDSDANTISGNSFVNHMWRQSVSAEAAGIVFQSGSSNNLLTDNTINNNLTGVWLRGDPGGSNNNNIFYRNTIRLNGFSTSGSNLAGGARGGALTTQNVGNGLVIGGGSNNNIIGDPSTGSNGNNISNNKDHGIFIDNSSSANAIRRNSISCNGLTQPLVGGVRSIYGINLNLNNGNNANISITPAFVYPPYILSTGGINFPNTPTPPGSGPAVAGTDVIEVYYDPCGTCQGQTYLGNATLSIAGSTLYWSFPAGSIPTGAFCSTTNPAGTCPSGIINISATRTNTAGNTSQFMPCSGVQVLPVAFLNVSAEKKGVSQAKISWTVAQIANANYYIIEKSMNGVDFEAIGSKKGVTNSALAIQFEFLDSDLWYGTTYYRVVQVDLDGSKHPSDIVALQNNGVEISVFPVPSTGLVHIWTSASTARQAEYQLVNVLGKEFLSGKFKLTEGFAKEELDLSTFPAGSYVLKIWINGEWTIRPIIKQD